MKYRILTTTKFDRSVSRLAADDREKVEQVIGIIANGLTLPARYKDHPLKGNKRGVRDCHVKNDLVLLYVLDKDVLILTAVELGSHSSLFG